MTSAPAPLKYNPRPITERYRITVFNPEKHGVAEFATIPGLLLDQRKMAAQEIADRLQPGYTVQVFAGVHTIGRSLHRSQIVWE